MRYLFEKTENLTKRRPENMASSITSKILEIRKESIKNCMGDLNTLSHRQHYIDTIDGVMYYDDSRAENVNATWFTFQNIVKPVVWIAGGDDRVADFRDLKQLVKQRVRTMVCVGGDNAKLKKAFQKDITEIIEARDVAEAVELASMIARPDDIVLFSPACKSSTGEAYADRGNLFTATVRRLEYEHLQ